MVFYPRRLTKIRQKKYQSYARLRPQPDVVVLNFRKNARSLFMIVARQQLIRMGEASFEPSPSPHVCDLILEGPLLTRPTVGTLGTSTHWTEFTYKPERRAHHSPKIMLKSAKTTPLLYIHRRSQQLAHYLRISTPSSSGMRRTRWDLLCYGVKPLGHCGWRWIVIKLLINLLKKPTIHQKLC